MSKMIKILIGSNGGLTGVYLAKNLRQMRQVCICGADCSKESVGKFFVDKQFYLPEICSTEFINKLIDLLNEEQIDIYLPTHSKEVYMVSLQGEKIRSKSKAKFIVSPIETFWALENKNIANNNLASIGIPVPEKIEQIGCNYPIFMKREIGSGGDGAVLIPNETVHRAFMEKENSVCFFQYIKGKEYTVDCLFDKKGKLLAYNQRARLKTIGGAVCVTENDNNYKIEQWIYQIANRWKFYGCVNFQYIVKDSIPYFIDINLRYSSGGLPLTVKSGLDIPKLIVKMLLEEPISKEELRVERRVIRMYRYFEEKFEE